MPATPLASVVREAKPIAAATIALDVSTDRARPSSASNCEIATKTPMKMIVASSTRRSTRRRVSTAGVIVPPASAAASVRPRRENRRSTSQAATTARTIATIAAIHLSCCVPSVATWTGMPRDRTSAIGALEIPRPRLGEGTAIAWRAVWTSRLAIWSVALAALAIWERSGRESDFDPRGLTQPFGAIGDALAAPSAAWDSVWYLSIADGGYADPQRSAFFPLYPLLVRAGGWVVGSPLVAGLLLSLACFVAGAALLHELTRLELGADAARWTVIALAWSPMSFFFSAVYSEALFLVVSVGAFLAARNRRWWIACALGGLGAATRSAGVVLFIPLALLMFADPPRPRDTLALLLVPAGLLAYMGGLAAAGHDAYAPFHAQDVWFREFAGPFGGVWDGVVAGWDGARQLLSGQREHVYFAKAGGDPFIAARLNLVLLAFLAAAVPMLVGAIRRLPPAYAAYAIAALALPLSYPVVPQPLMSLSRFLLVLFPLWMWWGWWLSRHPRARLPLLAASGALMVVFAAQFATFHWVA